MSNIEFDGQVFSSEEGESVLDCLLRNGVQIPHSCKNGICHSCVMVCVDGQLDPESQKGIKDSQQKAGYFKSCVCRASGEMTVSMSQKEELFQASIIEKKTLNERTLLIRLSKPNSFEYESGQFINLIRIADGLSRSYSIASIPSDDYIELHIRYYEDGKMSSWLKEVAEVGEAVEFSGPFGGCYYLPGKESEDILLAGIGTGMAPLYGIARDALAKGHTGKISVVQGAMNENGLYYVDEFSAIANGNENVTYIPSTVDGSGDFKEGKIDDVVKESFPSLKGFRVYLCGSPNTVNRLKRYSFLAGANMADIYSDPFTPAGS